MPQRRVIEWLRAVRQRCFSTRRRLRVSACGVAGGEAGAASFAQHRRRHPRRAADAVQVAQPGGPVRRRRRCLEHATDHRVATGHLPRRPRRRRHHHDLTAPAPARHGTHHRHRIDKYLDTLLANQPISDGEATDHCQKDAPQDGGLPELIVARSCLTNHNLYTLLCVVCAVGGSVCQVLRVRLSTTRSREVRLQVLRKLHHRRQLRV